jgi:hypothetical protein
MTNKGRPGRSLLLTLAWCGLLIPASSGQAVEFSFLSRKPAPLQTQTIGPLLFLSDHAFDQAPAVSRELFGIGRRLEADLGVPPIAVTVRIYVFKDNDRYRNYLKTYFPALCPRHGARRSMFLLRDGVPYIFAYRHRELLLDLRHEFTHATLNTALRGLPMWVDEGLAEFYEVGNPSGLQPQHVALLRDQLRRRWQPSPERLELLEDFKQMGPLEYAEAWSWIHFLLKGPPEGPAILRGYLAGLRNPRGDLTLSQRLERQLTQPYRRWANHVAKL